MQLKKLLTIKCAVFYIMATCLTLNNLHLPADMDDNPKPIQTCFSKHNYNNNTTNQEKKTSGDFGMPHAWFKMVKSNHYSPR